MEQCYEVINLLNVLEGSPVHHLEEGLRESQPNDSLPGSSFQGFTHAGFPLYLQNYQVSDLVLHCSSA